jgi:hypothetical protein
MTSHRKVDSLLAREPVRVYLYSVAVAVGALAVALDLVDVADLPVWLGVLGAVLAVPTVELTRRTVTSPATSADLEGERYELEQGLALVSKRPTSGELAVGLRSLSTHPDLGPDARAQLERAADQLERGVAPVVVLSSLVAEAMR